LIVLNFETQTKCAFVKVHPLIRAIK
jgi:hypothetical protein